MIHTASNLSTQVINEQRRITVTGALISVIAVGNKVRLDVLVAADDEVEVHTKGAGPMSEPLTEQAHIGPTIEDHLSTGLGCRCGRWKLDTSRRPVDPRAQHREHVAGVLDALLADRIDEVIDAIEETFLGHLPSKALTYCAQEDVNAGLDAIRERFLGRDDR